MACTTRVEDASSTGAAISGCESANGHRICDEFLGSYHQWSAPSPKVGLPLTDSFTVPGDTLQVFERVVMNRSPAHPCGDGVACIALLGRDDAADSLHAAAPDGNHHACGDAALGPRDFECVPDDVRREVEGSLLYYGYVMSAVQPTCEWWNYGRAQPHTQCFWTERAKVGRNASGQWEYEALGAKRFLAGKIPGVDATRAQILAGGGGMDVKSRDDMNRFGVAADSILRDRYCKNGRSGDYCDGAINVYDLALHRRGLHPVPDSVGASPGSSSTICDVIGRGSPFPSLGTKLGYPYFFIGANASYGLATQAEIGVEWVWDLFHQQFAAFGYDGGVVGVGASASVYMGLGFGEKKNVIDGWSGEFDGGSLSIPLFPPIDGSAGGFVSNPEGIVGASVGVSISADLLPFKLPAATDGFKGWLKQHQGQAQGTYYSPWDDATKSFNQRWSDLSIFGIGLIDTQGLSVSGHDFVQFTGPNDVNTSVGMALSILDGAGPGGAPGAAMAIAYGILRSTLPGSQPGCEGHNSGKCWLASPEDRLRSICN